MAEDIPIGAEDLVSVSGPVKSDKTTSTARHSCDVSLKLCCPEASSRGDEPRHSLIQPNSFDSCHLQLNLCYRNVEFRKRSMHS